LKIFYATFFYLFDEYVRVWKIQDSSNNEHVWV